MNGDAAIPLLLAIALVLTPPVILGLFRATRLAIFHARTAWHRHRGHVLSPFTRRVTAGGALWEIPSVMCDCGVWIDRRARRAHH